MKSMLYLTSALAIMGLAFWAYHENYKTQQALDEVDALQHQIGNLLETRSVLSAEWAYLNRPERLRELADLNFERLGLLPLMPEQLGRVDQVAYPVHPSLEVENAIDVIGSIDDGEGQP